MNADCLTNEEKIALKQFRANISDVIDNLSEYDSHDVNLIRWIRAREFNLTQAELMLRKSLSWRVENNIDKLRVVEYPEFLLSQLLFTPCGHDKGGALICVLPVGSADYRPLLRAGLRDDMVRYVTQILERGTQYMQMVTSQKIIYTEFSLIIDLEGFSLTWALNKSVLGFFIEVLRLFEANYPERMRICYVVNAPKIFEIFFPIIKPLLTQRTLSKVKVYASNSQNWRKALLEEIDFSEMPSQYGGCNTSHPWYTNNYGLYWPPRSIRFPGQAFQTVVVPAGDKHTKTFDLNYGNEITWNFKTDNYDIGFEFQLNGVPMFPYAKADAHKCVQDGFVRVAIPGKYTLVFDNTYSKYRSKTLHYAWRIKKESNYEPPSGI